MSSVLLSGLVQRRPFWAIVAGISVLLPAAVASAAPATMSFRNGTDGYTGAQDVEVLSWAPGLNIGVATTTQIGDSTDGHDRPFLIKFEDLGVLAGQYSSIISAQLDMRQTGYGGGAANVSVYAMKDANAGWIEGAGNYTVDPNGGATWENLADYSTPNLNSPIPWASNTGGLVAGTDYDSTAMDTVTVNGTLGSAVHVQFDISPSLVEQWITGGPNAGLLLSVDDLAGNYWSAYTSNLDPNESTTAQPMLIITYEPKPVPEPMTGSLLLIGGGMLMLRRKK